MSKMTVRGETVETSAGEVQLPAVRLRINGKKVLPVSGQTCQHVNPVTGQIDATVPAADATSACCATSRRTTSSRRDHQRRGIQGVPPLTRAPPRPIT